MRTHVAVLLDRSGSMAAGWDEAMKGLDAQIETVREMRTPDHEVVLSFTRFDDTVDILAVNEPIDTVQIDRDGPRNTTALYDAVGQTIETIIEAPPIDPDDAYLLCIISDGIENASTQFDIDQIKEMLLCFSPPACGRSLTSGLIPARRRRSPTGSAFRLETCRNLKQLSTACKRAWPFIGLAQRRT